MERSTIDLKLWCNANVQNGLNSRWSIFVRKSDLRLQKQSPSKFQLELLSVSDVGRLAANAVTASLAHISQTGRIHCRGAA